MFNACASLPSAPPAEQPARHSSAYPHSGWSEAVLRTGAGRSAARQHPSLVAHRVGWLFLPPELQAGILFPNKEIFLLTVNTEDGSSSFCAENLKASGGVALLLGQPPKDPHCIR